jgi:23S rRNA (uracil1939-C5)-methyltransferase
LRQQQKKHKGPRRPAQSRPAREAHPLEGRVVELPVHALALGGAGVGRIPEGQEGEGMAVFVPGALPGSSVRARLARVHRRHAEAVLTEVLAPSPDVVAPLCEHFGSCGGCLLQHLDPARQLEWKERQLTDALSRIGRVEPEAVLPAVAASGLTGFRNKMEFAFQGRGDALRLGLFRRDDPGRVFDLRTCAIFPAVGSELLDAVRRGCRAAGLSAFDRRTGEGVLRHLVLRHSVFQDRWLAQALTAPVSPDGWEAKALRALGEDLLRRFPALAGFVHAERRVRDGLAQAERTVLALGEHALVERLGQVRYSVSADAFFQTSTQGALALYAALAELAAPAPTDTVYDLYCGGGGIALFLAGSCGRVLGLDANPSAIADAEANARLNGLDNCRFARAELAGTEPLPARLPDGFGRVDVVVVDPPRDGLDAGVIEWLKKTRPARLACVSCNPATLARDAGMLAEAFVLRAVRAVDMFPHSGHVEALALFTPR